MAATPSWDSLVGAKKLHEAIAKDDVEHGYDGPANCPAGMNWEVSKAALGSVCGSNEVVMEALRRTCGYYTAPVKLDAEMLEAIREKFKEIQEEMEAEKRRKDEELHRAILAMGYEKPPVCKVIHEKEINYGSISEMALMYECGFMLLMAKGTTKPYRCPGCGGRLKEEE